MEPAIMTVSFISTQTSHTTHHDELFCTALKDAYESRHNDRATKTQFLETAGIRRLCRELPRLAGWPPRCLSGDTRHTDSRPEEGSATRGIHRGSTTHRHLYSPRPE